MRRSPTRPSGQTVQGVGMTSARTRRRLIDRLRERGIHNERVLEAMLNTPRHLFVTEAMAHKAYEDTALPIGHDQTISQPYVVAMMTELLLSGREIPGKVLEVGTGSGYQTAILAQLVKRVYSIERIRDLQLSARRQLKELDLINIEYMNGDGFLGWTTFQPYDGIIVTAAPREVPQTLLNQLAVGGRLVIPVGGDTQILRIVTRSRTGYQESTHDAVRFVPMVKGRA